MIKGTKKIYTITTDDLNEFGKMKLASIITGVENAEYEIHLDTLIQTRVSSEDLVLARIRRAWFEEQEHLLLEEAKGIIVENKIQRGNAHEELIQIFFRNLLEGSHRIVGKFQIIINHGGDLERYDPESDVIICRGGMGVKLNEMRNIGVSETQVLAVVESKTALTLEECKKASKELRSLHCICGVFAFGAGNVTNQAKVSKLSTVSRWVNLSFTHSPHIKIVIVTPRTHTEPIGDGYVFLRDPNDQQKWNYINIPSTGERKGLFLISLTYCFATALDIGGRFEYAISKLFETHCLEVITAQQPSLPSLSNDTNLEKDSPSSNTTHDDDQERIIEVTLQPKPEEGKEEDGGSATKDENITAEKVIEDMISKTCILS